MPIPNLQVNGIDIHFDINIKKDENTKPTGKTDSHLSRFAIGNRVNICPGDLQDSHLSDNQTGYHVETEASDSSAPGKLANILDVVEAALQGEPQENPDKKK